MDNILVIDDDPTNLAICKALLMSAYHVDTKQSGMQALGYLKYNALPDLILLDAVMPGMQGIEVCKQLKQQADTRHIPVLLLTEAADMDFAVEGYAIGAVDFIIKPIIPILLMKKVQFHLELLNLQKENTRLKKALEKAGISLSQKGIPDKALSLTKDDR